MKKGRTSISLIFLKACLPLLLIISSSAFFHSCEEESEDCRTEIIIEDLCAGTKSISKIKSLELFVFDMEGKLDSYEKIDEGKIQDGHYYCLSKSGKKRIVAIANYDSGKMDYSEISSYENFAKTVVELEDDSSDYPYMSGEAYFFAGAEKGCVLKIKKVMSEIIVEKVNSTRDIENVAVYIRNICSRAPLLDRDNFRPTGIIESGTPIKYRAMMSFRCYPNKGEGGMGTPRTELVICWTEDGEQKEYSEIINEGTGIERGAKYYFRISI